MRITVIGKAHMQGASKKTGSPYNFIQLHYNGPARNVVSLGAMTVNIDPSMARSALIGNCSGAVLQGAASITPLSGPVQTVRYPLFG